MSGESGGEVWGDVSSVQPAPLWPAARRLGGGKRALSALGEQGQQCSWNGEQDRVEESENKVGLTGTSVSV